MKGWSRDSRDQCAGVGCRIFVYGSQADVNGYRREVDSPRDCGLAI